MFHPLPSRAQVDLPVERDRHVLTNIVMPGWKAIMPSLKRKPTLAAAHAISNPVALCHRVVSIYYGGDLWKRSYTEFT